MGINDIINEFVYEQIPSMKERLRFYTMKKIPRLGVRDASLRKRRFT